MADSSVDPASIGSLEPESPVLASPMFEPFYCHICFETKYNDDKATELATDDIPFQLACGHTFCQGCVIRFMTSNICDGNVMPKCFFPLETTVAVGGVEIPLKCNTEITSPDIDRILSLSFEGKETLQRKYVHFSFMKAHPNGRECPNSSCNKLMVGDPNNPDMTCENCGLEFCYYHSNAHPRLTCSEYKKCSADEDRINKMFIEEFSKPCPRCGRTISKDGGCNHIVCPCGAAFCWLCGKEIDNSLFPRHFQWWNPSGCSNLQLNNDMTPTPGARAVARFTSILQLIFLGPITFVSSLVMSLLMCPCFPCMLGSDRSKSFLSKYWDFFSSCLTGWGMFYFFLFVVLPIGIFCGSIGFVFLLAYFPFYAAFRLYHRQCPLPEPVTRGIVRCLQRSFRCCCWWSCCLCTLCSLRQRPRLQRSLRRLSPSYWYTEVACPRPVEMVTKDNIDDFWKQAEAELERGIVESVMDEMLQRLEEGEECNKMEEVLLAANVDCKDSCVIDIQESLLPVQEEESKRDVSDDANGSSLAWHLFGVSSESIASTRMVNEDRILESL